MARVTEEMIVVPDFYPEECRAELPKESMTCEEFRALCREMRKDLIERERGFVKRWHSEGKEIVRR